jgi:hypothetical protein
MDKRYVEKKQIDHIDRNDEIALAEWRKHQDWRE